MEKRNQERKRTDNSDSEDEQFSFQQSALSNLQQKLLSMEEETDADEPAPTTSTGRGGLGGGRGGEKAWPRSCKISWQK